MSDTVTILEKAKARLDKAWYQGHWRDSTPASNDDCGVCAIGAVSWAVSGDPRFSPFMDAGDAIRVLGNALRQQAGPLFVSDYNDAPSTTKDDVLALFDRAIQLAKAEA